VNIKVHRPGDAPPEHDHPVILAGLCLRRLGREHIGTPNRIRSTIRAHHGSR
jgi:hypothetical protein